MASLFKTFVWASLTFQAVVLGCPAGPPKDGQFTIDQIENPNYVANCHRALARAYIKYGAPMPQALEDAMRNTASPKAKRGTGSNATVVTIPEEGDVEWLTPVQIGSPGQQLNLNFDTDSADLWVFSNGTQGASQRANYNPGNSRTAKKLNGASWAIRYGDGSSASGDVYLDRVSVGRLTVANQAVETARRVSTAFLNDPNMDGLVGLSFGSLNTVRPNPQKTFFDNAIPQLRSPVFTADLRSRRPGTYGFGFVDSSAYTGSIGYAPVDNSNGWWQFTSSGYVIGNGSVNRAGINGIADTGTTLLLLPDSVNRVYYAKVPGSRYDSSIGFYTFPCRSQLPNFGFAVGGVKITIPGSYFNFSPVTRDGRTCAGSLQPSDGIGINIFGDIALKAAYVVFDSGKQRIGWANKRL